MQIDTRVTNSVRYERSYSGRDARSDYAFSFRESLTAAETEVCSHPANRAKAPYGYLAKDGVIDYKGVTFVCDEEKNRITLGDVSNPNKCLKVSLKEGGVLMVNFDNIDDLTKAITMFSPEDQARIMHAITIHNMSMRAQKEIDDVTEGVGDSAAAAAEDKTPRKEYTSAAQ